MNFLSSGTIAGILAFLSAISIAIGKPALGAFLSDPTTATTLTAVVTGAIAIVGGVMNGVKGAAATSSSTSTPAK